MSSGRHNVFRVSGIPSNCEAGNSVQSHAKSFLLEFIEYQYQPHERGQIEPDIQIVPSCTVSCNTVNALVEFEPKEPEFLGQLLQNRDSGLLVSRRVNGKRVTIDFDLHFDGLTQLYPTPPDQTVTVDIVAITGLGGHAYGSWRSRTSPMMWLRDFLSEDMPRCRTMTYGYNSQLLKRGIETVEDYRRRFLEEIIMARDSEELRQRPIVFISHSFGGIILAEALIHAKLNRDTNPDMEALSKSTYGIFFLGVPHRGLWVGDMLDMLRSKHPNHPREELVKQLQVDSLSLRSQLDKFRNLCQDYEIVSFYELEQTRQLARDENSERFGRSGQFRTAVTSESALLQLPDSREKKFGFPVDHSNIAKFSERYSGPYKIALRYLQIFEKGAPEAVGKRFGRIGLLYPRQETSQPWHETMAMDPTRRDCLKSLLFDDIHARKRGINIAHSATCDWLFETREFNQWQSTQGLEDFNGVFWIKGKPGVGKSTLMKHMLLHLEKGGKYLIVAHFFNARGSALEKSHLGLLRSLVYQLLRLDGSGLLWGPFHAMYKEKVESTGEKRVQWSQDELKDVLLQHLPSCELSKPLLILVDALDECNKEEVRTMVRFLENLSSHARHGTASLGLRLRIGLSSRHYPEISMRLQIELVVEAYTGHRKDIEQYVEANLQMNDSMIKDDIVKRSSQIFLWVELVVELLNEAYNRGQIQLVRKKLEQIPEGLEDLFEQILIKDNQVMDETVLVLQWVLFCIDGPLQARELYFAVMSGVDPTSLGTLIRDGISDEHVHKSIKDWSKGLVEIYETEWLGFRTRFIHQSVNDFLLRNGRLGKLCPALGNNPAGISRDRLKDCCVKYLECPDLPIELPKCTSSLVYADPYQVPSDFWGKYLPKDLWDKCPFLHHAINYLLFYVEEAHLLGVNQDQFLGELYLQFEASGLMACRLKFFPVLLKWYNNRRKGVEYLWPLFAITECQASFAYFLLLYYSPIWAEDDLSYSAVLLEIFLESAKEPGLNVQGGILDSPLQAASARGLLRIARVLVKYGAQIDLAGGPYGTALQAAIAHKHTDVVRFLLDEGANVNAQGGIYGNALQAVVVIGDEEMVINLLSRKADVNARGGKYGTALQAAVARWDQSESSQIVHILLKWQADPNITGGLFGSALQAAVTFRHEDIVDLLIQHGAIIDVSGGLNGTAIHVAMLTRQPKMVEQILEQITDINIRGRICPYGLLHHEAEQFDEKEWAYMFGLKTTDKQLRKKLLKVQKDAKGIRRTMHIVDQTILHYAACMGDHSIVKLLLERRAGPNVSSGFFRTTLPFEGLTVFAEEELSIITGQTPLHMAATSWNDKATTQVLLDFNANIAARDARGKTPLILASSIGNQDIVEVLLARGANISDRDYLDTTCLIEAAREGHVDIVKLLVENQADVNAKDLLGRTALYQAAYYGHAEVVKYLLTLPPSRLEVNTKAGCRATELQVDETDIEHLEATTGSYHASFNITKAVISIHRLCLNGGITSLMVGGDEAGICIANLVITGGLLYITLLGQRSQIRIETLVSKGGYCCLQTMGHDASILVRNLVIQGGNVQIRTAESGLESILRIRDFEVSGGSLTVARNGERFDHEAPMTLIGAKHGFSSERQSTCIVAEPGEGSFPEHGMQIDEEGIHIGCYGKPWGKFGGWMWIMPEIANEMWHDATYFDHEGGLTPEEIILRKRAYWEKRGQLFEAKNGKQSAWAGREVERYKPLREYEEFYHTDGN